MRSDPDTVTASEIADFICCGESWRLAALGHVAVNQPRRDAGTAHHAHKAIAERVAGRSLALGRTLIAAALLAILLWALSR